jgi:hypothetical protein
VKSRSSAWLTSLAAWLTSLLTRPDNPSPELFGEVSGRGLVIYRTLRSWQEQPFTALGAEYLSWLIAVTAFGAGDERLAFGRRDGGGCLLA